jgi:hypothetical protein
MTGPLTLDAHRDTHAALRHLESTRRAGKVRSGSGQPVGSCSGDVVERSKGRRGKPRSDTQECGQAPSCGASVFLTNPAPDIETTSARPFSRGTQRHSGNSRRQKPKGDSLFPHKRN